MKAAADCLTAVPFLCINAAAGIKSRRKIQKAADGGDASGRIAAARKSKGRKRYEISHHGPDQGQACETDDAASGKGRHLLPTYVEYGAADIGVVGEDTIMEEGRKIYEVLDLGFGKCRMCVAGPEEAAALLNGQEQIRVATKYPKIARDYFTERKNQTVEIIKLNGSIELAPIVGLAEVIVDIVETGSTLKENGLKVLEEVCPLSARVVVNPVSMRMENARITKLLDDMNRILTLK